MRHIWVSPAAHSALKWEDGWVVALLAAVGIGPRMLSTNDRFVVVSALLRCRYMRETVLHRRSIGLQQMWECRQSRVIVTRGVKHQSQAKCRHWCG